MARLTTYDPEVRVKVRALLAQRRTQGEISRALGIPKNTIGNWAKADKLSGALDAMMADVSAAVSETVPKHAPNEKRSLEELRDEALQNAATVLRSPGASPGEKARAREQILSAKGRGEEDYGPKNLITDFDKLTDEEMETMKSLLEKCK